MQYYKIIFAALVLFAFVLLSPAFARAEELAAPKIFFSEIAWRGSSVSTADEWLELYNDSNEIIDISKWTIFDKARDREMLKIDDGLIAPKGCFLNSNKAKDHRFSGGESVLNIDPDVVDSGVSLSNDHFQILLLDSGGQIVDIAGSGGAPFVGTYDSQISSMERSDFVIGGDQSGAWRPATVRENLDALSSDYGTPENSGRPRIELFELTKTNYPQNSAINLELNYAVSDSKNDLSGVKLKILKDNSQFGEIEGAFGRKSFAIGPFDFCPQFEIEFIDDTGLWAKKSFQIVCYQKSADIHFSEFLPHPKNIDWNGDGILGSSDEWIELVNLSQGELNLDGWAISDKSGKTFGLNGIISAGQYLIVENKNSKISINDDGDTLFLRDPEGSIIDQVAIPSSSSYYDYTFAKWAENWYWTTKPTKLAQNIIVQKKVEIDPPPSDIAKDYGQPVEISGEVIEVERAGFIINTGSGNLLVKIIDGVFQAEIGRKVKIRGISYGGSFPYIEAKSTDVEIIEETGGSAASPVSEEQVLTTVESSSGPSSVVLKTTKIITTRKTVRINLADSTTLVPVVLGATHAREPRYFKFEEYLLYFVGLFIAGSIVFVYGISRQI